MAVLKGLYSVSPQFIRGWVSSVVEPIDKILLASIVPNSQSKILAASRYSLRP
jgi:hypothetical protein